MMILAVLMLLAKRASGLLRSKWHAASAFAQLRPEPCCFGLQELGDRDQVKGRAPGLSERALSFSQTEARAKRTLEHPPP